MEDSKDVGTIQWYVLLGAMLASKETRATVLQAFMRPDVPKQLLGIWDAMHSGDGQKVWREVGVVGLRPPDSGSLPPPSVAAALIKEIQARSLAAYIQSQVAQAEFSHKSGMPAEAVADWFEGVGAAIRQRQAVINKPQTAPAATPGKESNGGK